MNLFTKLFALAWILTAPDDGGGSGGENDEATLRDAGFQKLATKYNNDATGLAKELYGENYTLRRKNETLKEEVTTLKGRVPTEGSTILTAEQSQQWIAYQALGAPDKVKEAVEERGQLQGKLAGLEREKVLTRAATLAKYDYDVLQQAISMTEAGGKKLEVLVEDVEVNGEKTPTAFVKDGDQKKPLAAYAEETWPKLMVSLALPENNTMTQSHGTPFPAQHQGSGGGNRASTPRQQTEQVLNQQYPKPSRAQAQT